MASVRRWRSTRGSTRKLSAGTSGAWRKLLCQRWTMMIFTPRPSWQMVRLTSVSLLETTGQPQQTRNRKPPIMEIMPSHITALSIRQHSKLRLPALFVFKDIPLLLQNLFHCNNYSVHYSDKPKNEWYAKVRVFLYEKNCN